MLAPDHRSTIGSIDSSQTQRGCGGKCRLVRWSATLPTSSDWRLASWRRSRALGSCDSSRCGHIPLYWLPWPKGVATAPEMLTTTPSEWRGDIATLHALVDRVGERSPAAEWGVHPNFGPLSGQEWARLSRKHLDHHLTQFGVLVAGARTVRYWSTSGTKIEIRSSEPRAREMWP